MYVRMYVAAFAGVSLNFVPGILIINLPLAALLKKCAKLE